MSLLLLVVVVAGLTSVVALVLVARRPTSLPPGARRELAGPAAWRATHETGDDGQTAVLVVRSPVDAPGLVLDRQVVAVVAQDDPEWERTFSAAMDRARERAALLRAQDEV